MALTSESSHVSIPLVSLDDVTSASVAQGLILMGALHPRRVYDFDDPIGTTVLLGTGPGFWEKFINSPEYHDTRKDPIDRWSKRVVTQIAAPIAATCSFPSDGPPYPPFIDWALKTGRFHLSPIGMMVHDTVGLMVSLRGALHLAAEIEFPQVAAHSPCDTCHAPCATTCPVGALGEKLPYDVGACRMRLDTSAGKDCMSGGCLARRACPLSAGADRTDAQSALHMKAFHPS